MMSCSLKVLPHYNRKWMLVELQVYQRTIGENKAYMETNKENGAKRYFGIFSYKIKNNQ